MTLTEMPATPAELLRRLDVPALREIVARALDALAEAHKVLLPPTLLDTLDEAIIERDARHAPERLAHHLAAAEAELLPLPSARPMLAVVEGGRA